MSNIFLRRMIGDGYPAYFIADMAANHDGDLQRAKELIWLAQHAGADCAKFQTFDADRIVSDHGFRELGKSSHQATWSKSVYETYKDASMPREWIPILAEECRKADIDFASTPYDCEAVAFLYRYVRFYKVGSGDITWLDFLAHVADRGKPVFLSTGASTIGEVQDAMDVLEGARVVLMQCQTNYTGEDGENLKHINLRVLQAYAALWPQCVLGLSDHTRSLPVVLGAVALGAKVVERHFTDDKTREGPDHHFSMEPKEWRQMVNAVRELEAALGSPQKRVTEAERETVVLQRRCVRAAEDIEAGQKLTYPVLACLRPCPDDAIRPEDIHKLVGKRTRDQIEKGAAIRWCDVC